ncbi:MAG TPA: aldo/keto reductase [Virgibacillus sp.]|nr:aldo/keto reductase [Virgibacillus sp.]HLR65579.1 aldo/keto reductase [Virgibacillus sp.]
MVSLKRLGNTELEVNPIGLGAMAVGGQNLFPQVDETMSRKVLTTAIQNGMNFIDTAFYYGFGRSEELIGETLKDTGKRHDTILATKAAHEFIGDDIKLNNTPEFLTKSVNEALQRLQTDYIDLFYIHNPDDYTPKDEAIGALKLLRDEGKIRSIGVSKFTPNQLKEANKDGYVDVYQGHYNLLERSAETTYFPYMVEHGISYVPFFPFASGVLAGKYNKNMSFDDHRANKPHLQGEAFTKNLDKVEQLRPIAEDKGADIAQIVLAWYLTHEAIDAVIPGAKRPAQVLNNLKAADIELSTSEIQKIDQIFQ